MGDLFHNEMSLIYIWSSQETLIDICSSTFVFIQIDVMQIYKDDFFSGGHEMKQNAMKMLLRSEGNQQRELLKTFQAMAFWINL